MKHWWELLPEPYNTNPIVRMVLAPPKCKVVMLEAQVKSSGKKVRLGVLEIEGKRFGLHALTKLPDAVDHDLMFDAIDIPMMPKVYVGPLASIPQSLLMTDEIPILMIRDEMHRPFMQLRNEMTVLTRGGKDDQPN